MTSNTKNSPLFVLALDAADQRNIKAWADQGLLPNIKRILDTGLHAALDGQDYVSENGLWVSLFSGVSRGDHGYYYWRPLKSGSYTLELSDQSVAEASPFWSTLKNSGRKVLIIDPPETHCVPGMEGVQVSNWSPHNARFEVYSEPPHIVEDLKEKFGNPLGFEEMVGGSYEDDKRIFDGLIDQIRQKTEFCKSLLASGKFDLFVLGFQEIHIAGHQFWKYTDHASHPTKTESDLHNATRRIYQAIDAAYGEISKQLPANTAHVVLSNMGVQEDYPNFELTQDFCKQLGYHCLSSNETPWTHFARLLRRSIPQTLQKKISDLVPDGVRGRLLSTEWLGGTDWSKTTVFPIPSYYLGFLRVNLKGREPMGSVEPGSDYLNLLSRVEEDLAKLTDPVTGKPAIRFIKRAIDLYGPDRHHALPDIFFDWAPTSHPKKTIIHPDTTLSQKDMFFNRDTRHDLNGFMAAAGPQVTRAGDIGTLSLLDAAPFCLALLNGQDAVFPKSASQNAS